MELENESGFWKSLCLHLNNPKLSVDSAVKVSVDLLIKFFMCTFVIHTNV